jgi:uncharacterized protein
MIEKKINQFGEFGIYATSHISAGSMLFSYSEWMEDADHGWQVLTLDEVAALDPVTKSSFLKFSYDVDFGKIIGTTDHELAKNESNFMNHSCEPNMTYDTSDNIIAKHDILPGEELTIDYGTFIVNVDQDFICRCGSVHCRGRITKDDWKMLIPEYGLRFPTFMVPEIRRLMQQRSVRSMAGAYTQKAGKRAGM